MSNIDIGESELIMTLGGNSNPAAQEKVGVKNDAGKPRMHLLPVSFVSAGLQTNFGIADRYKNENETAADRFEPLVTALNDWYWAAQGIDTTVAIREVVICYVEGMLGLSEACAAAIRAFEFGVNKYAKWNWRKGMDWCRLYDGALRHLTAWVGGEDNDTDSGLCHLDNLGACIAMLSGHTEENLGTDDRRSEK